jgi:hypothetical protein
MAFIQYQIDCLIKTFQCPLKNHLIYNNMYIFFTYFVFKIMINKCQIRLNM